MYLRQLIPSFDIRKDSKGIIVSMRFKNSHYYDFKRKIRETQKRLKERRKTWIKRILSSRQ
jgi:hypothetical protein